MKPDTIVCWPIDCDFPLWRQFIERERHRLGRVFVVFTEHHDGFDYRSFVKDALGPTVECFDSPYPNGRDWRDVAVNAALDKSDGSWVWFTEQDFRVTDDRYWESTDRGEQMGALLMGFRDPIPRWHPASLYVPRWVVEQTTRYFGPIPWDHFVQFSQEASARASLLQWTIEPGTFTHMQGLSQNHYLTENGIDEGVFKREEFRDYLAECLRSGVRLHQHWTDAAVRELAVRAG